MEAERKRSEDVKSWQLQKAYLHGLKEQGTKLFGKHSTVGLLMDYPCLPQKNTNGTDDRTDEEKVRFKKGLIAINQWYLHECTTVIVFDTEMPGHDSGHTNVRPHSQRGWCKFELLAASIVKRSSSLWSLRGFEEGGSPSEYRDASVKATKMNRPAPMDPDRFGEVLRGGVAAGELAFTANADLEVVADQYAKAFEAAYTETTELYYGSLNWGDEELKVLASALQRAKELGGLTQCKRVVVDRNLCTEVGLIPLVHALRGTSCQLHAENTKCCSDDSKEAVRAAAWDAGVKMRLDAWDRH